MATTREAIVICLDVGPHMSIRDGDASPTALEQAVECINWILQRKIFTESKDEFAIVLFGTNDTDNPLASDDSEEYSNICVVRELQTPTWDLVRYIQNEVPPADPAVPVDFLDAVIVSLDLLSTSTEGKKYAGKQLVLFSNLGAPFADDQVDKVVAALENGGIDLTLFGPRLYLNDSQDMNGEEDHKPNGVGALKKTAQQELGEQFMAKILEQVNGQSYSLRQGLSLLSRFITRVVRPTPWKCNFELGGTIKIPICMYVKTKKAKLKQSWKWTQAQDPNAEITMQRTYHKRDEDEDEEVEPQATTQGTSTKPKYPRRDGSDVEGDEEDTEAASRPMGKELDKEDVVRAFKYGNTIVPLDALDLTAMKYQNTEKCLKLLSFIQLDQAKRQYYLSDGCHLLFPEAADQDATTAFTALWEAMVTKGDERVALVRYAHSARSAPRLGVLIPSTEENGRDQIQCFVFVTLPFTEDCRTISFPALASEPSDEHLNIVDELITWMDLTHAQVDENGRRCEAFKPTDVVDPHLQNTFASLSHRALHENQPLPPVSKHLVAAVNPLEERLQLAKPVFDRILHAFPLKRKEVKKDKRTANDIYQAGEAGAGGPSSKTARTGRDQSSDNASALKISSVRPVEEYAEIVDKDEELFEPASEKLETIITQFIFEAVGSQFYEKAISCIEAYRRKSIKVSKPAAFNNFLRQLKRRLIDGGKQEFLTKLAKDCIGLITDRESPSSTVTANDANAFFEEETKPVVEAAVSADEEPNLLDELE